MDRFDLVQSFLEQRERGKPIETLIIDFESALQCLGIAHFACGSHVDPVKPPRGTFLHHNYPRRWIEPFSQAKLHRVDPVFTYAEEHQAQFSWSDPRFLSRLQPGHRVILAAAATLGIKRGFTVPLQRRGNRGELPASCSFVLDSSAMDESSCFAAQLLAASFFEAARSAVIPRKTIRALIRLSPILRECLELAVLDLTDWRISELLMISESSVKTHMRHAMHLLGTPTREQAVARALALGLIRFGDIQRAQETTESRVANEAAYWLMLLDDAELHPAMHPDYERWLAASAAHAEAMKFLQWLCNPQRGNSDLLSRGRWRTH